MHLLVDKPTNYGLDTKNGATLKKLLEKLPISEKAMRKLLLEIEKMNVN